MSFETILVILSIILVLLAASIGIIWFFALDLLRPFLGSHKVRGLKSSITGYFLRMIRAFCCDFKLVLSGDLDMVKKTAAKKCILIGNHQTELDWLYIQYFYQEAGREGNLSAVMKGSLGSIPIFGYGIRDLSMCLLDRNWEKDRKTFDTYLSNFMDATIPVCAYICPEGTTISESTYQRSQSFAKKTNRPILEHLLLPRSTGFAYMLHTLAQRRKETGEEFYVYDTTMQFEGYHGEICDDSYTRKHDLDFPTIVSTFWKSKPIVCHLHVKVVSIDDIIDLNDDLPTVNQKVENWLDKQWVEKESEMECFINNQSFSEKWNECRKSILFDRIRKLKDSFAWILLFAGAFAMYYALYLFIRFMGHVVYFL